MPRAHNTSPPASVLRFHGGQFAKEPAGKMGQASMEATNLGGYVRPRHPGGEFAATVHTHRGVRQLPGGTSRVPEIPGARLPRHRP